jgi:hypothetical protein
MEAFFISAYLAKKMGFVNICFTKTNTNTPTFKAINFKPQIQPNKTVIILIRLTHNRKAKYLNTCFTASNCYITKAGHSN